MSLNLSKQASSSGESSLIKHLVPNYFAWDPVVLVLKVKICFKYPSFMSFSSKSTKSENYLTFKDKPNHFWRPSLDRYEQRADWLKLLKILLFLRNLVIHLEHLLQFRLVRYQMHERFEFDHISCAKRLVKCSEVDVGWFLQGIQIFLVPTVPVFVVKSRVQVWVHIVVDNVCHVVFFKRTSLDSSEFVFFRKRAGFLFGEFLEIVLSYLFDIVATFVFKRICGDLVRARIDRGLF